MRLRILLVVPLLVLPSTLAGVPREEREGYVGGLEDALILCSDLATDCGCPTGGALDSIACFPLDGSESRVTLTIVDDLAAWTVAGWYMVMLESGELSWEASFCGAVEFDLPDDVGEVRVLVFGPVWGPPFAALSCGLASPGVGLKGNVTARFT